MDEGTNWKTWLLPLLTEDMRQALAPLELPGVTELRLRLGKPMEVVTAAGSRLLYAPNGRPMLREGQQEGLLQPPGGEGPQAQPEYRRHSQPRQTGGPGAPLQGR